MSKHYRKRSSQASLYVALVAVLVTGGWLANKKFHIFNFVTKELRNPYVRGINEMQAAHFQNAQASFELANSKSPNNANTVYSLAWALQAQGKDDEALKYYQQAETLAKASGDTGTLERVYTNTGAIYLKRKQFQNAELAFRSALKINDKSVDASYQLGMSLLAGKKTKDARNVFERTLALDPTYQAAKYQIQLLSKVEPRAKPTAKRKPSSVNKKKRRG